MIPLVRPAAADAELPYVARFRSTGAASPGDALLVEGDAGGGVYSGDRGLVSVDGVSPADLDGDVVLIDPLRGTAERLLRTGPRPTRCS